MKKFILFFIISISVLNRSVAASSEKKLELEIKMIEEVYNPDVKQSIVAADELLKHSPKHTKAHFEKARALAYLDRHEEALVSFDLALKYRYKDLCSLYYCIGYSLEAIGKLKDAIKFYDLSIYYEKDSHSGISYFDRDRVLMKLGKLGPDGEKIIDLEEEFVWVTASDKEWERTLILADELLKYKIAHPCVYFKKASALRQLGRYEEALISYDLALKAKYRPLGYLYYERGLAFEALGKLKEALVSYELSIKSPYRNNCKSIYFAKDRVLMKLGKLKPAGQKIIALEERFLSASNYDWLERLIVADELIKYKINYPEVYFEKAQGLKMLGRYEEALISYDLALKYKYRPLSFLYGCKADALEELGRLEDALAVLNQAMEHTCNNTINKARYDIFKKIGKNIDKVETSNINQ